jgi:hypothetical protein
MVTQLEIKKLVKPKSLLLCRNKKNKSVFLVHVFSVFQVSAYLFFENKTAFRGRDSFSVRDLSVTCPWLFPCPWQCARPVNDCVRESFRNFVRIRDSVRDQSVTLSVSGTVSVYQLCINFSLELIQIWYTTELIQNWYRVDTKLMHNWANAKLIQNYVSTFYQLCINFVSTLYCINSVLPFY